MVYGRRENGKSLVPSIKEIHRIPQMPPEPLGARRRRGQSRKKSRTVEPEPQQVLVYNPEEGWDEKTDSRCLVREYGDEDKEVERRECFQYQHCACGSQRLYAWSQALRSLRTWCNRNLLLRVRSTSRRSSETETSSRRDSSLSRPGQLNRRRAPKTTPLYAHHLSTWYDICPHIRSGLLCHPRRGSVLRAQDEFCVVYWRHVHGSSRFVLPVVIVAMM